jgi:hypothetical protein
MQDGPRPCWSLPRFWWLLPLLAVTLAPLPADAADPGDRAVTAREAARRYLCPHGGSPVRGQRGRCRPTAAGGFGGVAGGSAGWDAGLPPPDHRQQGCPEGTRPATALARPEAVRCVPR